MAQTAAINMVHVIWQSNEKDADEVKNWRETHRCHRDPPFIPPQAHSPTFVLQSSFFHHLSLPPHFFFPLLSGHSWRTHHHEHPPPPPPPLWTRCWSGSSSTPTALIAALSLGPPSHVQTRLDLFWLGQPPEMCAEDIKHRTTPSNRDTEQTDSL